MFIPAALLLALPACSDADDSEALGAADDGAAQGSGGDAGDNGAADGVGEDGFDGGGTGGAGDDGTEPPPDEPQPPVEEPPVECNTDEAVTLYLSPDDSNSMSSPVQVRAAVLDGFSSLSQVPIRTWEFLNYYHFDYAAPTQAGQLAIHTDLIHRDGTEDGQYVMQIGIASEIVDQTNRAPIAVTLVLDTSGSMSGHPMDMLKETCRAIAGSLREGDTVSMVTWSISNSTVLGGYAVSGPDDATVLGKCDALEAGGGTDLFGGLSAGYTLAEQVFQPGIINRIVLVSDGGANAGITEVDLIAEHAGTNDEDGIYMVGVGVGDASTYNDDLMDVVTDAGKGASVFIGDPQEATKIFGDQFISTMGVAARDVQVRLDMPPGFEVVKFSGEEISGDPAQVEPQHLAPSDTMVFHQEIATCAPELVTADTEFTVTLSFLDGATFESREIKQTVTFGEMESADHALLLKGAAIFAYAESLKLYRQGDTQAIADALVALQAAAEANPEDVDLAEIKLVLEAL